MTTSPSPEQKRKNDRPRLRCPACAFLVPLPASVCPQCGVNLRTGYLEPGTGTGRRGRLILGVVVLALIVGLAGFFFLGSPTPDGIDDGDTGQLGLGEALDTFEGLASHPAGSGVDPAAILDRTQRTAGQVEDRRAVTDEAAKE